MDRRERFWQRGRTLRDRHLRGELLTSEEQTDMDEYVRQVESVEAERLRPAAEQTEARIAALEQRNATLRRLTAEREALAVKLRTL